jgi:hypothetical protein
MKKKPTARLTLLMSIRNMSLGFYLPEERRLTFREAIPERPEPDKRINPTERGHDEREERSREIP